MKLLAYLFALVAIISLVGVLMGETHQWLIFVMAGTISFLLFKEIYNEKKEKDGEQS